VNLKFLERVRKSNCKQDEAKGIEVWRKSSKSAVKWSEVKWSGRKFKGG